MNRTFRLPSRSVPLLLGLVIALALHALLLSYLQLKRNRQVPAQTLQSKDNTPELLEFASLPPPPSSLDVLPLPQASPLLPPPSDRLAPLHRAPASGKKVSRTPHSRQKGKHPHPRGKGLVKLTRQRNTPWRSTGALVGLSPPSPSESSDHRNVAMEQLRTFQRQQHGVSGPVQQSVEVASIQKEKVEINRPVLRGLDSAQQVAYQTLWNRAVADANGSWATILAAHPGPTIEVRQLLTSQAQGTDLLVRHGQFVVLGDHVLLFWFEGKRIWLLRSELASPSPS